ncbi:MULTISPECIES: nucleotidyltransferase family protein [unclassified Marinobacter]|uniref:nucleotidyltransferase family protein n=1 Tax=unclassified Marinobacter TaxID=83889 RepID=UPI00273BD886|nr:MULTISPECIES: nucleotidyltransferase family protein [unclassified Marinobacter]MDP4546650.1 nucleotidyltransferase family protein [Marinobacter sp. MDS2]
MLAAGRSARMGRAKQTLNIPGQGTLLGHAIGQARLLSRCVSVVVGARYPLIRYRCGQSATRWVYCSGWQQGLSASLAAGINTLGPSARGVYVLVGDQPLLDQRGLVALRDGARQMPDQVWAADYGSRVGVPAWIPRRLWPEVLRLQGDAGAGRVLNQVDACRVKIAGVALDVDTPARWQDIKQMLAEQA